MVMWVGALQFDLLLGDVHSLKEKRSLVRPLIAELRRRYETIDIDGARVLFTGGGWGLVRASNTNPYLTLRFEAHTEGDVAEMKRVIYGALSRYPLVSLPE